MRHFSANIAIGVLTLAFIAGCSKHVAPTPAPSVAPKEEPAPKPKTDERNGGEFSCRQECLEHSPFCLDFPRELFDGDKTIFIDVYAAAKSSKAGKEVEFDNPYAGEQKYSHTIKGSYGPIATLSGSVIHPEKIRFKKSSSEPMDIVFEDSRYAPEMIFDQESLQTAYGGKVQKIEFVDQDPIFVMPNGCIYPHGDAHRTVESSRTTPTNERMPKSSDVSISIPEYPTGFSATKIAYSASFLKKLDEKKQWFCSTIHYLRELKWQELTSDVRTKLARQTRNLENLCDDSGNFAGLKGPTNESEKAYVDYVSVDLLLFHLRLATSDLSEQDDLYGGLKLSRQYFDELRSGINSQSGYDIDRIPHIYDQTKYDWTNAIQKWVTAVQLANTSVQ